MLQLYSLKCFLLLHSVLLCCSDMLLCCDWKYVYMVRVSHNFSNQEDLGISRENFLKVSGLGLVCFTLFTLQRFGGENMTLFLDFHKDRTIFASFKRKKVRRREKLLAIHIRYIFKQTFVSNFLLGSSLLYH